MNKDMVELDLPLDSQDALSGDPEADLVEVRKRFDVERQQLRREITALRQQNREREQQLMVVRERDREHLYQETVKLTGELFTLRRQIQEQTKLQAECDRLQGQLEAARAEVASLREGLAGARRTPPAAPPAPKPAGKVKVRRPRPAAPVHPMLEPEPQPELAPAPEAEVPVEETPVAPEASVFSTAEEEQPFAPTPPAAPASPQVVRPGNSFHRSGNPIPVRIALSSEDDEAASGWVVERSLGGMTLMLDQEVAVETQVRVRNARPTCTRSSWIAATVKQVHPEGNSFKLVCRFVVKPSWEQMQQFW